MSTAQEFSPQIKTISCKWHSYAASVLLVEVPYRLPHYLRSNLPEIFLMKLEWDGFYTSIRPEEQTKCILRIQDI